MMLGAGSVFGAVYYDPTYGNLSENFILNITISAPPGNPNITQVMIKSSAWGFAQNHTSNLTSFNTALSNYSVAGDTISWQNITAVPLVNNNTNQSFYIMMNSSIVTARPFGSFQICIYNNTNMTRSCNVDAYLVEAITNAKIGINMVFSGYVKIENGSLQNNVNVTLYEFVNNPSGPSSDAYLSSVLTNAQGMFRFSGINGSKELYKVKMFYNNGTATTHVGSVLPPMPKFLFFEMPMGDRFMDAVFKKPANLNGTIYYLQPATTLNITAKGNKTGAIRVKFGYEVIDQNVGFPVDSNVMESVWSRQVIVPTDRAFTVMSARPPNIFTMNDSCTGIGVITPDACPAPPTSVTVAQANLTQGAVLDVELNLSFGLYDLTGCISVYGNNTLINVTTVQTKMMPWTGFVPPMDAMWTTFNITNGSSNIIYNDKRCPGGLAWYNLSMMGSASGISYMLEFYGKNASTSAEYPGKNSISLAAFQNITMGNAAQSQNFTLRPLAGVYNDTITSQINTSRIKVNILNSTGGLITTSMHVNVQVKNPTTGTVNYIIESLSNGAFYLSILNNSNWVKVMAYPQEGPPVDRTLNLSLSENNITVWTGEAGFRKFNNNGSLEQVNVSDSTQSINISFYSYADGCNLPTPPESCLLTQMDSQNFNPMTLMMAGKVNLEMKYLTTGTTLYFVNFDLFAAKPPTNSVLNGNASQANSNAQTQVWEAGSFVPDVYDYAFVGMPYNVTSTAADYINESYRFNMSLPYLKDENWAVVWNRSAGDTLSTLPDNYAEYNTNQYSGLLSALGVNCSTSNASEVCFMNKSQNMFWVKVPHFSGGGYGMNGGADVIESPSSTTTSSSSSSSSSGGSSTASSSVTESNIITSVAADVPVTIKASNSAIGINDVVVTVSEVIGDLKVSFTKLSSLPEAVTESPAGKIYSYLQIEAPKLAGKLSEAKIHFQVSKLWLTDNGFSADNVVLQRFTTSWDELSTKKLSEDDKNAYYESVTPGFSYFAVSATAPVTKAVEEPVEQPKAAEPETSVIVSPPAAKSNVWPYVLVLLVVALIALVVVFVVLRKKR